MRQEFRAHKITKVRATRYQFSVENIPLKKESPRIRSLPKTDSRRLIAYFAVTSECVIACTDSAMRFCTPTLRISFAT